MITKLYLKNYRAFEEMDLKFSKINLFFGPNNSGKSSIISSINLLSQTILSTDKDVPILLNGDKEELGTYRDVVYKNRVDNTIKIGIEAKGNIGKRLKPNKNIKKIEGYFEVEFKYRPRRREIIVNQTITQTPIGVNRMITNYTPQGRQKFIIFDKNSKNITKKLQEGMVDFGILFQYMV